jgi:hypothetical protein
MRALLVVLVVACSAPATPTSNPKSPSPYAQLEALMPKVLTVLDELGVSMRRVEADCAQLAKLLRAFADKHAAMLPQLGELVAKLSDQERQRFELAHHDDRVQLNEDVFAATTFDCAGNTEFESALATAGFKRP